MHWVKYHEHTMSLPSNFVASGDALQRLNPIAGQGMAKAMVEATTLDAVLRASVTPTIGPAFFKKVAARTGSVWTSTKIGDYAYEVCEPALGETREFGARQRKFNRRIGKRALAGDQDIQLLIMGIRSWVLPPTDMLAPSVLMKLALDWICGQ
jgi:2-polyprenyl-6-methoxyphenol hydroxylase-like FAD-dependent oxidoreductase